VTGPGPHLARALGRGRKHGPGSEGEEAEGAVSVLLHPLLWQALGPAYHRFMTRAEYEAEICKRLPTAKGVEPRDVGATERCCHTNVDRWVTEHGGHAVRGWLVYMPQVYGEGKIMVQLTAHSVVGDEQGSL
jgi:hypothetical protein